MLQINPIMFLAPAVPCKYSERTLSAAVGIIIPTIGEEPDAIFKECCYTHIVLADPVDNADFRNDYSGFYHQSQINNETCEFFLYRFANGVEYPMDDDTYGIFYGPGVFLTNPKLQGYLIQWRKVLATFGEGAYKIIKRVTISGITFDVNSFTFNLKRYGSAIADTTVRIDCVMNGRIEKYGIDFGGTSWKHSLRLPGFFGRREPQITEDNLIKMDYTKEQISLIQDNEYKFQTNYIPSCLTNEFWDFIMFGNDLFANDYNLNNHSYDFVKFPIKFASNEGTGYSAINRKAILNLTFTDKKADRIKRNF